MFSHFPKMMVLLLLATLCLVGGCSDEDAQKAVMLRKTSLDKLADAYIEFAQKNERSPKDAAELADYVDTLGKDEQTVEAAKRVREGDIIMYWGADLKATESNPEGFALGFEPAVLRSGGYIVTAGGTVNLVTGKTFLDFKEPPTN